MPPSQSGGFSEHLRYGISAVIGTQLKSARSYYSAYYNMKSSDGNFEDVLAAAGLPIAPQKTETGAIQSLDPLEGDTKRVSFNEWAIGFEVTQVAWEDDRIKNNGSALRDAATGIADSLRERVEVEAHRPLNAEGFDGTFTVLPDGLSLFNTAHLPIVGGEAPAQSNRNDVDLSVTSYRDAAIVFEKWFNDRGLRIPGYSTPEKIIVPPDLRYVSAEIFKSTDRPDTANRAVNVNREEVDINVTPYITDVDAWFLQGQRHFMDFYWRWRPRFDNFDDRRRRIAVFVGIERFQVFPWGWIGMHGSQGA